MSSLQHYLSRDPAPQDSEPQGAEMVVRKDMRTLVDDTTKYPHQSIAFMQMEFPGEEFEYAGTGFMADGQTYITAAHNVLKIENDNRIWATTVDIRFGLNGPEDFLLNSIKCVSLEGNKFTVPQEHMEPGDEFDIAWIQLSKYHDRKMQEGAQLGWSLDDLPKETFYTCSIPKQHGAIDGFFYICGKKNILGNILKCLNNDTVKVLLRQFIIFY